MSRHIDFSQPLSADDLQYAQERPWLIQDAKLQGFDVDLSDDFTVDDEAPAYDSEHPANGGANGTADEEEELEYSELNVDQLKEELGRRELSKSGSKEQLIARLEEDDAESE